MNAIVLLCSVIRFRSSRPEVFCKNHTPKNLKHTPKKLTGKHLCQSRSSPDFNFIKKEIPTQVFTCEFCKIFKKIFFLRTPLVVASVVCNKISPALSIPQRNSCRQTRAKLTV